MSVYSDHNVKLAGGEVHFLAGASESHTLQPGDFFDVEGEAAGGAIQVSVESLDFHEPSFVRQVRPHPDPDDEDAFQTWFNCVPVTVELYRGEQDGDFMGRWKTPLGAVREGSQEFNTQVDGGPLGDTHTRWRLRVTNTSQKTVQAIGGIGFVRDRHPIAQEKISLRVFNSAFSVVINALAPYAEVHGSTVRFGFGSEVADMLGLGGDHPLRERTKDLGSFEADGELQSVAAKVVPGSEVRTRVEERWLALDQKLAGLPFAEVLREKNNKWRDEWLEKIEPDLVAVHIRALVSDIDLSVGIIPGFEFDVGSIEDISIDLFLVFEKVVGHAGHVLFFAAADTEGLVEVGQSLGIVPSVEELLNLLVPYMQESIVLIHRYFAEVLVRMAPFLSELPAIFIDAQADASGVLVRYTFDPADQRATRPATPEGRTIVGSIRMPLGEGRAPLADERERGPAGESVDRGVLGAVPGGFELADATAVTRLDRIDTLVFVMMENRSFDHMLGYLRTVRGENYRGFPDNASNSFVEEGFTHPIKMEPITNVLRQHDVMQIPIDPYHSTRHVAVQMAGGAMSGFAQDLIPRGAPQFALTYYTDAQLPLYYELASHFMVCDQWYSAHPGGTYPNRWATLSGTMPELENLHVDDRRLGFLREATIFDLLTEAGIPWTYYENNVSMIRMYSRFRLDDRNVLPFLDEAEGFEAKAAAGTLPPVVFVEPRITGVPPLEQASDDHPPANLRVGQEFVCRVVRALAKSQHHWQKALLLITYDEHGGFFDHVAPPGTPLGPPEWLNKIPRIHPQGAEHMGPRVPTFVVSPFVNPGTVSHEVFDHTSIIKTILVRHRKSLFADQLLRFGPRVNMINHLGVALDRDDARPGQPLWANPCFEDERRRPVQRRTIPAAPVPGARRRRPTAPPADENESTDFRLSLARAMLPKRR